MRTALAERQRRWRQRQREGIRIVPIEVDDVIVSQMIDYGLIDIESSDDTDCIARAVAKHFRNALLRKDIRRV